MAGVSISHLIIFIASILIAGTVVGVAFTGVDQFNSAMEDRSLTAAEQLRTDFSIISDPASDGIYENDEVTLLLKNTGDMNLVADERQINVILNGRYVPSDRVEVDVLESDGNNWRTSDVLEVTIETDGLDDGDHRVAVRVNSAEDAFEFRVGGDD